ncbi:MAG: RND transporter, partial [Burkholderiaceae bacterium]|nr:RND transporter [Burkholderiaceae bacterium]
MKNVLLHALPSGRAALPLVLAALLAGCAAGPDYQAPAPLADNALPRPANTAPGSSSAFGAAQAWR